MQNAFDLRLADTTIFAALMEAARRHGRDKDVLEDANGQSLTYGRLITGSLVLGSQLSRLTRPSEATGILLPNVNGLVITLFGLNAFGRQAAMLNFTSGSRNLVSAVKTGPVPVVVTSRRFVAAAGFDESLAAIADTQVTDGRKVQIVYLEDVRAVIGTREKIAGALRAVVAPWLFRARPGASQTPAIMLYTSGTEGLPKGVVLTNANLVANARQIFQHARHVLSPADIAMNPLPMFHSFGLTAGTLMPLLNGLKVVLYPSPLHYRQVPKLIAATKATLLFATDTFLQGYARAAAPSDLASIRYVVAGAERVKDATRLLWQKTGTVILEGYGATECAPVIAVNLPKANRHGSVGHLLPGIEARLDPVEGIHEGGKLVVKGPNVMAGYILADAPGKLVAPPGGWHDTGDIVTIDDGFVSIRGRAKRFAKIGGEMVSLASIEAMASSLWPDNTHAAVSLPDPKKGETSHVDHRQSDG